MSLIQKFKPGVGYVIGTFKNITYGDKILSISTHLAHDIDTKFFNTKEGRIVRAAYWVVDDTFDIDTMNLDMTKAVFARDVESLGPLKLTGYKIGLGDDIAVSTDTITAEKSNKFKFSFYDLKPVEANKIFFAFISVSTDDTSSTEYGDFEKYSISFPVVESANSIYYYSKLGKPVNKKIQVVKQLGFNILVDNIEVKNDVIPKEDVSGRPSKIKCSNISYRTFSPIYKKDAANKYYDSNTHSSSEVLKPNSTFGFGDGGETFSQAYDAKKAINIDPNKPFENDFTIDEGALKDVIFANPEEECYEEDGNKLGRWVFKRSQIKFTIPPVKDKNGKVVDKKIKIRMRIYANIFDNSKSSDGKISAYRNVARIKEYSNIENNIVICPRDEGILDNSEFRVVFDRCYKGGNAWSDESVYYFRTYQKPMVNLAYHKKIRKFENENDFSWTRIPCNNTIANFRGDRSESVKFVLDALNVMFATPKNDASGIPIFVRFYIAEYKCGRQYWSTKKDDNGTYVLDGNITTLQDLFNSNSVDDYANFDSILNNESGVAQTAYLTGINNADGAPLIFSGKLNGKTTDKDGRETSVISELIENEHVKAWTYDTWDNVASGWQDGNDYGSDDNPYNYVGNDVLVPNPWYNELTPQSYRDKETHLIIPDHYMRSKDPNQEDKYVYETSNVIMFRAGYIYLIKIRAFHGAAAGAINSKYGRYEYAGLKGQLLYGYGADVNNNSGKYEYINDESVTYGGRYPYINKASESLINDRARYGMNHPFELSGSGNWVGPEDGTSGLTLVSGDINKVYPGFSEADSTFFKPIATETSKNNIITVHPSSPQVGANQSLSFNYRHCGKNLANIDFYANDNISPNESKNYSFGRKITGIQNTMTRIMAMYTSCAEYIIQTEFYNNNIIGDRDKDLSLSLKITPFEETGETYWHTTNTNESMNNFIINYSNTSPAEGNWRYWYNTEEKGLADQRFYNPTSGCYYYNEYRILGKNPATNHFVSYTLGMDDRNISGWPENGIAFEYNVAKNISKDNDPLGNVYRWMPVINAVKYENEQISEVSIEGDKANDVNINPNDLLSRDKNMNIVYMSESVFDNDINNYYYFNDKYGVDGNLSTLNLSNYAETSSILYNPIKEWSGNTSDTNGSNSPYPAMSTMNVDDNKTYFNKPDSKYGYLYRRVSYKQDCENGESTKLKNRQELYYQNNACNIQLTANNIAFNENVYSNKSEYSLTRVTHYLFFKTHIRTEFEFKYKYSKYTPTYDEEGTEIPKWTELPEVIKTISFGNENGISAVYGEDNCGYGRCLSAEDISNKGLSKCADDEGNMIYGYETKLNKITGNPYRNPDVSYHSNESGGLEVPILTRYTPMLPPRLLSDYATSIGSPSEISVDNSNNYVLKYLYQGNSKEGECESNTCLKPTYTWGNVTPYWVVDTSSETSTSESSNKITEINDVIYYPWFPESLRYNINHPNGGSEGVKYTSFYFDANSKIDSDYYSDVNLDFFGGLGICTGYHVLLVPSDPIMPNGEEFTKFFNNTNGHWNFYNQPSGYYNLVDKKDILNVRSKSVKNAKTILVGYNIYDTDGLLSYLNDNCEMPAKFGSMNDLKGRTFVKLNINVQNILNGKIYYRNNSIIKTIYDNEFSNLSLSNDNTLKTGVSYDLVIVPLYSNMNYTECRFDATKSGSINGINYSQGITEDKKDIIYAGSNPLVAYNYIQVSNSTSTSTVVESHKDPDSYKTNFDGNLSPCSECNILACQPAIVYPNVDFAHYNLDPKYSAEEHSLEGPGFWLNNSFRLVFRMPSYYVEHSNLNNDAVLPTYEHGQHDKIEKMTGPAYTTIEEISHGILSSENGDSPNDVKFSDIQIHIGKISELKEYGYPYNMENNLNLRNSKEELAECHIIAYKDYANSGVFSKSLNNDNLDLDELTGGAMFPDNKNYQNRFIEVNLSNCLIKNSDGQMVPIYTEYPEGYYIQFRYQTIYGNSKKEWSDWYGGSFDGGKSYWDMNGTGYYVPTRNYSEILTEFRNLIKNAYPDANSDELGDGSLLYMSMNNIISDISTNSDSTAYYFNGVGNDKDSMIVPYQGYYDKNNNYVNEFEKFSGYSLENPYPTSNLNTYAINGNKSESERIRLKFNTDDIPGSSALARLGELSEKNAEILNSIKDKNQLWYQLTLIDYIITNMLRLYYKPNYNYIFSQSGEAGEIRYDALKSAYLALPWKNEIPMQLDDYAGGWSKKYFKQTTENNVNVDDCVNFDSIKMRDQNKTNYNPIIRKKDLNNKDLIISPWNINKYYRSTINTEDILVLINNLKKLCDYCRQPEIMGIINTKGYSGNADVTFMNPDLLNLTIDYKNPVIGAYDLERFDPGRTNVNNIGHTETIHDYLTELWNVLLQIISGNNLDFNSTTNKQNVNRSSSDVLKHLDEN